MIEWARSWPLSLVLVLGCVPTESHGSVEKAPTFSTIKSQILDPKCTFACHSGGEFAAGGLDLGTDPYGALLDGAITAPVCSQNPMKRVTPGDPDASLLYALVVAKVDGSSAPCGDPMPQGSDRPALSDAESESIRAWIANGAKRN